jgi:hypothetical protein
MNETEQKKKHGVNYMKTRESTSREVKLAGKK